MPARSYCGPAVHLWLWVRNCQSYNVNCYALQVVATVADMLNALYYAL